MPLRELAWHWARFFIPSHWEISQYSVPPEQGRLPFYSKDGLCGTLSWRIVDGTPDHERIQTEICRRSLLTKNNSSDIESPVMLFETCGQFNLGVCEKANLALGSLHFPECRLLLEWVFHLKTTPIGHLKDILLSYQPNVEQQRHWSFQDFHLQLPDTYHPSSVNIFPGNTTVCFETHRKGTLTLRRWALPDELLGDRNLLDFGQWLMGKYNRKVIHGELGEHNSFEASKFRFKEKGSLGFEGLIGLGWEGDATIWKDTQAQRVFAFERYGPKGYTHPKLQEVWV